MSVDAIYSTIPTKDWVFAIEKLYDEKNVIPQYCITHKYLEDIKNSFDNVSVHDSIDAIQGRFLENYNNNLTSRLDEEVLAQFQRYESVVLKMMDRMDSGNITGAHFTYSERIRHYHRQLSYWICVIDDIDPDLVVFGATPHLIYDYILYAVCEQRDIETIIFTHTNLPDRFCVRRGLDESALSKSSPKNEIDIPSDLRDYLSRVRGTYSQAEPDYMKDGKNILKLDGLPNGIFNKSKKLISYLTNIHKIFDQKPSYIKIDNTPIEKSYISHLDWYLYRLKSRIFRNKLKITYNSLVSDVDLTDQYFYFPLHYQPERTTCPEGGQYVHQYLAINLLASNLPSGLSIYVKEHPSQFRSRLNGEQGRTSQYYNDLNEIPDVHLIPLDYDSFDLIDNSEAVVTVTGTAGWESLVRGVPSIVFGNAWYRNAPGCIHVETDKQIHDAIRSVLDHENIPEKELDKFVSQISDVYYYGSLNSTFDNNGSSLYKGVCDNSSVLH